MFEKRFIGVPGRLHPQVVDGPALCGAPRIPVKHAPRMRRGPGCRPPGEPLDYRTSGSSTTRRPTVRAGRADLHDHRPLRARHHLCSRVGDRPVRFPLRVLHGGKYDLSAQEGAVEPRGAGPAVQHVRRSRRPQAPADRRRAAGAAQHHQPVRIARPASSIRAPRGADADHQRQSARALRGRPLRARRAPGQRLARYPGPDQVSGDHPLGQIRQGDGRDRRGQGGGAPRQDQCGGAQGRQRRRARPDDRLVRRRRL